MQDVYGRIFSPAGVPLTGEFLINQFTTLQSAHAGGGGAGQRRICRCLGVGAGTQCGRARLGFAPRPNRPVRCLPIPAWTFMRGFTTQWQPWRKATNFWSIRISILAPIPHVAAGSDGGFMMAWDARDMTSLVWQWLGYLCAFVFQRRCWRHRDAGELVSLRRPIRAAHCCCWERIIWWCG